MSLFEDTNPRPLKELLAEIHSRTMALPDFQRDFVWEPSATQDLIVSIANNYPAGSLLRVRDTKRLFAAREFEGAPPLNGKKHTFLVLDGQQRLTSLYQAFFGIGEHRYFLNLKKLMDGLDFEDAILHVRASTKWAIEREHFEVQAQELLLPLKVLKDGNGGFSKWARRVARRLDNEQRLKLEDALDAIEERWINTIDDYHFPVVTLSESTEADALCTIFETLNRTGVKLSVFELLTARFWPKNIRLRELWEEAQLENQTLKDFGIDPYYVLQSIALASRKAPSCKRSDVLYLKPTDIEKWWSPVIEGLVKGLEILQQDCKVMLPKWLPYQTMLVPLAAVLAMMGQKKGVLTGVYREKLKRWFWCAVFGQAYESASNTQSAKDFLDLVNWLKEDKLPDTVKLVRFDPKTLLDITPRQRSIYRGVICLVLSTGSGARDFHTHSMIDAKLINEQSIDDHHIFPDAFLQKIGVVSQRNRDCILNRTLIDRITNQLISNRAPSDYMAEMRHTKGFPFETILSSHLLPVGQDSPFWSDNYKAFLAWRQERIWREIKQVTGITEAADLEAEVTVS